MKNLFSVVLFLCLSFSGRLFCQTNTIKVSKPGAARVVDSSAHLMRALFVYVRISYNLAGNSKSFNNGDGGVSFMLPHGFGIGPEISLVNRTFDVTGYNVQTGASEPLHKNSEVEMRYLRMPVCMRIEAGARSLITFGIAPSYLLTVTNTDQLLTRADFYSFNLRYSGSIGRNFYIHGRNHKFLFHFYYALWFGADVQPNLQTEEVRDPSGKLLYNQRSRNYQIGLEERIGIHYSH